MSFRLRTAAVAAMVLAVSACMADAPRYIFYFIGDGMGMGAVMSHDYWRRATGDTVSAVMTRMPVSALCTTYSASSPVTDSAAAGTALATGVKTRNSMVGMSADSVAVPSVAARLQELGYGTGVVTSVAADDATPAAFYAHVPNRKMYAEIDAMAARSGLDFIAGAGLHTVGTSVTDSLFRRYAYTVTRSLDSIASAGPKVVFLGGNPAAPWSLGYAIDNNGQGVTLADMTRAAISHLERYTPDAFFLMVEGGAIDHAAHANDAGALLGEMEEFDKALGEAMGFYALHPDETLIVVTADHDTGGLAIGNPASGYDAHFDLMRHQRISKTRLADLISAEVAKGEPYSWEQAKDMLGETLGLWKDVPVTVDEEMELRRAYEATFVSHEGRSHYTLYADFDPLSTVAFQVFDNHTGAGWVSNNHTGNPVPVFATGRHSGEFGRMLDNTDIPAAIIGVATLPPDTVVMKKVNKNGVLRVKGL